MHLVLNLKAVNEGGNSTVSYSKDIGSYNMYNNKKGSE